MLRLMAAGALLLVALVAAAAPDSQTESPVAALQALLARTDSIGGRFEQEVRNEDGDSVQRSEGEIWVQRPFKLRWETEQPFRYLVVTDGETLWRYDPDLEQLNTEPFSADLAQAPVLILTATPQQLQNHFDVSYQRRGELDIFTLLPRGEAMFSEMSLQFAGTELQAMELRDSLGQHTRISLLEPAFNTGYGADLFTFSEERYRQQVLEPAP